MATSPNAEIQLTPEQRRRLGAVYQLILSWRRENNVQKTGQNGRPAQTASSSGKPESIVPPPDVGGMT